MQGAGGRGQFAAVWAVCRGQAAAVWAVCRGSLQGAGGSGLGSFRQKAPLAVLGGALAAGGSGSSFGGRGRGFGISGLRQQLYKQLP